MFTLPNWIYKLQQLIYSLYNQVYIANIPVDMFSLAPFTARLFSFSNNYVLWTSFVAAMLPYIIKSVPEFCLSMPFIEPVYVYILCAITIYKSAAYAYGL